MIRSNFSKSGAAALACGISSYGLFFGVLVYAIGLVAGCLASSRLDGAPARSMLQALAIDFDLLALFAFVCARPNARSVFLPTGQEAPMVVECRRA